MALPIPTLFAAAADTDSRALWRLIAERYDAAQAHKAASTFDTRTELVADPRDSGLAFVLKVAAQLRDKPRPPPPPEAAARGGGGAAPPAAAPNPFLPPDPALLVCHLPPAHSLVLNKFNVMPYHLLVITREFESQADPLRTGDLAATRAAMAALAAAPGAGGALAFYNCGPLSGASQPHKHVQVVPLPLDGGGASSSSSGGGADPPFAGVVAAATAGSPPLESVELRALPFASFAARLPAAGAPPEQLEAAAAALLARCRRVAAAAGQPAGQASYNALLTRDFLMMVPRSAESAGPVSCNSVAFAGSFFVRSEEELAYVRRDPLAVLAAVGFPWS
eukprot:scaffold20.g7671.t1